MATFIKLPSAGIGSGKFMIILIFKRKHMFTEKEIKALIDLAESKIRDGVSREEALETFVGAGILDWDGNFTKPYRDALNEMGVEV